MPSPATTTALLAAIEPLAAYVARTPPGNAHADRIAAAVDAVADYVEATEAEAFVEPAPDWEGITLRMAAYIDTSAHRPNPLAERTRRHLDTLGSRAARPLSERMALATLTSHHLGTPALYDAIPPQ